MKNIIFFIFIFFLYGCKAKNECHPKVEKISSWVNLMPKIGYKFASPLVTIKAYIKTENCKNLKVLTAKAVFKNRVCEINNVDYEKNNQTLIVTLRGCRYEKDDKKLNLKLIFVDKYKNNHPISVENLIIRKIY